MKVKKYVAPTMPEAMNKIRKELGSDAVILSSKEIQEGGFLGFFKKRKIEVIAALDKGPISTKQSTSNKMIASNSNIHRQKGQMETDLINEMKSMRLILERQSQQQIHNKFALEYQVIYQHLIEQEVGGELATDIVQNIVNKHEASTTSPDNRTIQKDLKQEIENRLSSLSFAGISNTAKVVHFVGPTGVGKTTTLAKVAATSMLKDKKKVAFITMDTYRIAAIDQLKTYAKILDTPVEVVYSVEDYKAAIEKLKNYDLILVDTAGRNYRDEQYVKELEKNMISRDNVENYLVLSLTAKPKDINDIYYNFRHIHIKSLIFTKVDETRQYGSLLNIPLTHNMGISYLTNGQEVPDNILEPTKEVISNLIVGDLIDS
ncbi:flagellar biosynthesis protein FlhF [Ornithinibacillus californiensis]|uniref:flagellar biosynthesis protein FlhF n=1 Tax=Ornithinibacillus californiensis TaxID=161536 RepID=UPI00064D8D23|nr:flagellar biosynthesis protein FlhF [Ornithinibacillus californiensis]